MTMFPTCVGAVKQRLIGDFVDRTPVQHESAYAQWLAGQSTRTWTPAKVRRIVVMRRRMESFADIGRAIGKCSAETMKMFNRLPEELR